MNKCEYKHDIPWSAERVRERLLFLVLGAFISAGPWMCLDGWLIERPRAALYCGDK